MVTASIFIGCHARHADCAKRALGEVCAAAKPTHCMQVEMRKSSATSSEGQRLTNITSDSESRPVAQSCKCVPQKQLTCEQHFFPQLRVSALQNRASLQEQSLHCTRGLGPHHPLIRDWYDKRKSDETTVSSPLVVQQQQCSPTDLLSTSILAGLGGDIRNAKTSAETDIKADSDRQSERDRADRSVRCSIAFLPTLHEPRNNRPTERAAGGSEVEQEHKKNVRKSIVKFTEVESRRNARLHTTHTSPPSVGVRPSTIPNPRVGGPNSRTFEGVSTTTDRSMDSILSTASIASPKDYTTNSLTSLQSLPLIHSNILTKAKSSATTSSGSSSSFLLHSDSSEREEFCSEGRVGDERGNRSCRCSVINLRIPFGKVEEWGVPQRSSAHGRESGPAQAGYGEHSSPEVKKPEMFEDSANNSSALSEWIM